MKCVISIIVFCEKKQQFSLNLPMPINSIGHFLPTFPKTLPQKKEPKGMSLTTNSYQLHLEVKEIKQTQRDIEKRYR